MRKQLQISLPEELLERLDKVCNMFMTSRSEIIKLALIEIFESGLYFLRLSEESDIPFN